jgi:hypothetical protein
MMTVRRIGREWGSARGAEIEIARLSTLAITQTSIIIKYSLTVLYAITISQVTKKNSGE